MKKLITGAVAALALLFGFASCSGDLHDSEVSKLYVEGDMCSKSGNDTVRLPFTMTAGSDTEQKLTFTYNSSMNTWGGGSGTANFKVTREATGWAKDWGAKKGQTLELSVNDQEWLDLEGRDAANSNPGNIVLKDLADGNSYTLIVKYDAPAEKLSIKCTGAVTDYPILTAVIVNDTNGKELTSELGTEFVLTRSGTDYWSSRFTPTKDGSVEYYLTNGYLYWSADGEMSTTKPTTNYITSNWTFDSTHSDWLYAVYADASSFASDQKLSSSSVKLYDTTILAKAGLVGSNFGWDGSTKLSKDDDTTYHYDFTALAKEQTFSIQEVAGAWATRWCGQQGSTDAEGVWDKSNYLTINPSETKALTYVTSGDPEHAHMKLSPKSEYRLTFKITGKNAVSVTLTCTKSVEYVEVYGLDGYTVAGAMNNWNENAKITKVKDGEYSYTFTANSTSIEFGLLGSAGWASKYTGATIAVGGSTQTLTSGAESNNTITGLTNGNSYTLHFYCTKTNVDADPGIVTASVTAN